MHGRPSVAVVGCGRWGVHIVRDLVELDCDVIAVDPAPEGRERGRAAGAARATPDLVAAAALTVLDGVVVAAPTRQHVDLAFAAAALGVPVFVEKPLSHDVAAARRLVGAHGDTVFVMHKWHYHPGVEALAAAVRSGRLGTLREVHTERLGAAQPETDIDVLWRLAPHEVSIARCIVGSWPDSTAGTVHLDGDTLDVAAVSQWANGPQHHWRLSTAPGPLVRTVRVVGTHGSAVLDGPYANHIRFDDGSDEVISTEFPLLRELRVFRDHLLGGPPPPTTAADGLAAIEIIAALSGTVGP